ncbi:MAG TPA: SPOR domain-containing protein [Sphingomicrobium sp.]
MRKMGFTRARLIAMLGAAIVATGAPAANVSVAPESPGTALSRHIRVLASNPRDFNALIGAGRAALELGDVQAAAGFFGRAEESYPNAPAAKAGLGAAMAHMGDADGAIFYFDQASRLGASALTIALDRGLARDLNGQLGAAQSDYRLAVQSLNSDEGRRRLALSLAIGRDRAGAMAALQPLLNRRDPAAQRTRAFVLALLGDQVAAGQAIETVMPGGSARFAPFFTYLPHLSVQEKAAAVHLGMFPDNAAARVAQLRNAPAPQLASTAPPSVTSPPPARVALNTPPPNPVRRAESSPPRENGMVIAGRIPPRSARRTETPAVQQPPAPSFSLPSTRVASASPSFSLPSASSAPPAEIEQAPMQPVEVAGLPEPSAEPAASEQQGSSALVAAEQEGSNLSGIDKLLATIAEAPPPPQPKLELEKPDPAVTKAAAAKKAADKKAADKKAAEKKARDAKLAAEKKEREEAARLGTKGTYWVQLAGGSNQDRMATEYRKLSAKAGALLKSRPGYVTEGKDYFRLVIGPFDSKSDSQAFVNKLEKEGVDSFSWTRTPAQIKIEKLSSR